MNKPKLLNDFLFPQKVYCKVLPRYLFKWIWKWRQNLVFGDGVYTYSRQRIREGVFIFFFKSVFGFHQRVSAREKITTTFTLVSARRINPRWVSGRLIEDISRKRNVWCFETVATWLPMTSKLKIRIHWWWQF